MGCRSIAAGPSRCTFEDSVTLFFVDGSKQIKDGNGKQQTDAEDDRQEDNRTHQDVNPHDTRLPLPFFYFRVWQHFGSFETQELVGVLTQ